MLTVNRERLINGRQNFLRKIWQATAFNQKYSQHEKILPAYSCIFVASHLAFRRSCPGKVHRILWQALWIDPKTLFKAQFWSAWRMLVFSFFSKPSLKFAANKYSVPEKQAMGSPPFFTVVIPTYNRAAFIAKTLFSVLAQTCQSFEIIVVDDGSTDNTQAVVNQLTDPRITYHRRSNGERGAARNTGSALARGQYITFLDSDDLLYPNFLQYAFESIQQYNNPPFLHMAYEVLRENGKNARIDWIKNGDISCLRKGNPLSCIGVLLRKDVAQAFPFQEDRNLSGSEDWELWLRIAANYGLCTDNRISAALVDHGERSVMSFDEHKLANRKNLALKYAFRDPAVVQKFTPYKKQMTAYCDSYISLHLMLSGKSRPAWKYMRQAIFEHSGVIFEKRFLVIIKHFLLNLLGKKQSLLWLTPTFTHLTLWCG
jgi:glycosyltransferase involved in cell wall biosynthesis